MTASEQSQLDRITPPVAAQPQPDSDDKAQGELRKYDLAGRHAKLSPSAKYHHLLEHYHNFLHENRDGLTARCEELQRRVDDLAPRCRSLEDMHRLDVGITTWAGVAVFVGNGLVAYSGFHDNEVGKQYYLFAGLIISGIATLFIVGLHRLWMPKSKTE